MLRKSSRDKESEYISTIIPLATYLSVKLSVNEGLMRTLTEQHRAVTLPALAAAHAAASVSEPPSPQGQKKTKKPGFWMVSTSPFH